MAAKKQGDHEAKKRKRISGGKGDGEKSSPKKLKLPAKSPNKVSKKPFKSSKEHTHKVKSVPGNSDGNEQLSKRELRLRAKVNSLLIFLALSHSMNCYNPGGIEV